MPPRKAAAPRAPRVSKNENITTNKVVTVLHADLLSALGIEVPAGQVAKLHVQNYTTLEVFVGVPAKLWRPKPDTKYTFAQADLMTKFHIVPPAPTKPAAGGKIAVAPKVTMTLNSNKHAMVFTIVSTEQHTY